MTTPLIRRPPTPVPDSPGVLIPQLRRSLAHDGSRRADSAASIALSRRHDAVIVLDGVPQTPADLGRAGLSIRAAWDQSAANLLRLARARDGARFWLRPLPGSSPGSQWCELAVDGAAATSWLAHPRTFTMLDNYLSTHFGAAPVYAFDEDTSRIIRVRGQGPSPRRETDPGQELMYSSGFPVPVDDMRGTPFSPASTPLLLAA